MQVIDNAIWLSAIGGGDDGDKGGDKGGVSCTVGTSGANCVGSPKAFYGEFEYAFNGIREFGGRLGCWLWDVLNP